MEEAATPLPSEETTPPVTNIYFGAIRVVRAVITCAAPDFSYLSGEASDSARRRIDVHTIMSRTSRSVNSNSCASACKFSLAAQPSCEKRVCPFERTGGPYHA